MQIISASRRTDIPAFYSEWLMSRTRAGYVRWRNPFGGKLCEVSLRPEDVAVIAFWSKDYGPLEAHLPELDARGYRMVFHYTITGLPEVFEPHVPPAELSVMRLKALSERYGPEAVSWRYDPVLISSLTPAEHHLKQFSGLAAALEGSTTRCVFSFPTFYGKVRRNTVALRNETGIECFDPEAEEKLNLVNQLAEIGAEHGITLYSCCGDYLVGGMIQKAHCVDGELLRRLYPDRIGKLRGYPTRPGCGCFESKDIGAYDTCPHGCIYCYANTSPGAGRRRYAAHLPETDMLIGDSGMGNPETPSSEQGSLLFGE